jgi:peptidoglycan/LPS O-acetylase OafA/YrhL
MAKSPSRRRLPRLLFWSAATLAFVMAVLPHPPQVPGAPSDKVQHILAFLALAALARWAYPSVRKRVLLLGLAVFGAAIELVQAIPQLQRDSDPLDWVADVAAATAVFVLIALWPSGAATRPPAGRA